MTSRRHDPLRELERRQGAGLHLCKVLRPGEEIDLLGGRGWVCGLLTPAASLRGADAEGLAEDLALHWAEVHACDLLFTLEMGLPATALGPVLRVPMEAPPEADPRFITMAAPRRDNGARVGAYRGLGQTPRGRLELFAPLPLRIPFGSTLHMRAERPRRVATLTPAGWMLNPRLSAAERGLLSPHVGAFREPPPVAALPWGAVPPGPRSFALPPQVRAQVEACLAPGTPWAGVEERFLRFDWVPLTRGRCCIELQHAGGALLEVWLDNHARVAEAQLLEGDAARALDRSLGDWHRRGQPLLDLPEVTELIYTHQDPGRELTLTLFADGFASLCAKQDGFERMWSGRVAERQRDALYDALRRAGFPEVPRETPPDAADRLELSGDGRREAVELAGVGEGHPYLPALRLLQDMQQQLTRGAVGG